MCIQKPAASHRNGRPFASAKAKPRALIAGKRHVQECINSALERFGFVTAAHDGRSQLPAILSDFQPDLFTMWVSAENQIEGASILQALALQGYEGKVLLLGAEGCPILAELQALGLRRLSLSMMPPLSTPICERTLSAAVRELCTENLALRDIDLLSAITSNCLELWYQPKYDIRTFRLAGAEALVRMRHPRWGIVKPAEFVPQATNRALIELSKFVIGTAMSDWARFATEYGELELAINVPLAVLTHPSCMQALVDQLPDDYRFRRGLIEMDAAEVIADPFAAKRVASELTHHQLALSVDDVDEDWVELYAIEDAPIAEIKVDRSLLAGCAKNLVKQSVCKRIVEFAHVIDVRTVAEGVESRPDLLAARELGFDLVQGYICGRPVNRKHFISLLTESWCAVPQYARAA
jgi:EAL domain-containing protein (putative c-di-GMP-specific phosphodiesterase class I)